MEVRGGMACWKNDKGSDVWAGKCVGDGNGIGGSRVTRLLLPHVSLCPVQMHEWFQMTSISPQDMWMIPNRPFFISFMNSKSLNNRPR